MEDMSTKPDDSGLFFPEFKHQRRYTSDALPAPVGLQSTSAVSSQAVISEINAAVDMSESRASPPVDGVPDQTVHSSTDEQIQTPSASSQELAMTPDRTLYFLQASRSIRIAWLLEELGLSYTVETFNRKANGAAPDAFKKACGASMGKAPVLRDGELLLQESGAITQYLLEEYDTMHYLLPDEPQLRSKVMTYIHAAEGTFVLHGLVPYYVHRADSAASPTFLSTLATDTGNDLDWLEGQIKQQGARYLVGDNVTAADTMMAFGVQFILAFKLHPEEGNEGRWPHVRKWLANVEANTLYQRAVKKTGYKLG